MVDLTLVALIALTAAYAGGVVAVLRLRPAGPARALLEGAGAAAGVTASFALMLALARVWLPGTVAAATLLAVAVVYFSLVRDLKPAWTRVTATGAGIVVGLTFLFVSYLAVMALIGAAGLYLVLRLWLRTKPALLVMGGTFGALLTASAGVFTLALSTM